MREFFKNHFPVSIRWSHRVTLNFKLSSIFTMSPGSLFGSLFG